MKQEHIRQITALRRALHRIPEPAFQERETLSLLKRFLRTHTTLTLADREGWFYAVREGTDPAAGAVAFRADMDALPMEEGIPLPHASRNPGCSHKCGHDGHCAALCGLALELEDRPPKRTVYLIFQPAEEVGGGGARCAPLLREKGVSEVYAFHNLSGYPEGQLLYRRGLTQPASEGLTVRLTGRPAHASAPEEGRSPAEAAARLVLLARALTEEPHRGMVLCTVTGVRVGEGDFGIAPGEGEVRLTLRAEEEAELRTLEKRLRRGAETLAEEHGLTVSFAVSDRFPETRNDDACLDRVLSAAERLGIPAAPMGELWRASEDFGHYTKQCPGAMFYLGNGTDYPPLHTVGYDCNDRILPAAADLFLVLAEPES